MKDANRFGDLKKGNRVWIIKGEGKELREDKILKIVKTGAYLYLYLKSNPELPIHVDPYSAVNNSKTIWLDNEEAKQYILETARRKWKQVVEQLDFLIGEEERLNNLIQKYGAGRK